MKVKTFAQFVRESRSTDDPTAARNDIAAIRDAIARLIQSGAMDCVSQRDLLDAPDVRSENTDPDQDALNAQLDALKRDRLRNQQQMLRVKNAQAQKAIRKIGIDIANVGQKRVTR